MEVCTHSHSQIYTHSIKCLLSEKYHSSIMYKNAHSLYAVLLIYTCKYLLNDFLTLHLSFIKIRTLSDYKILIVWYATAD